jgi:hypothetical protein
MASTVTTGRYWLIAGALLCLAVPAARAQGNVVDREIKALAGSDSRVGVFTNIRPDCAAGPLPAIKLVVPPSHGAVTVKRATLKATNLKRCLATEAPALVAFYRAVDNFNGADTFDLEITFNGGGKQVQHFRIVVTSQPAQGQGI